MALAPPESLVGNARYGGQYAAPRIAEPGPLTTTASTSPPPSGTTLVDYAALLAGDPLLGSRLSSINASDLANQAQLRAAQQNALARYGEVPASFGNVGGNVGAAIDQTTRDLAAQNTSAGTSTVARLLKGYTQNQQTSDASLAARGILRSGAYGQHATENLQNYTVAKSDANQQLLDYLGGLYSGYTQQQQALQAQAYQAQLDALMRLIAQINAGQIGGPAPPGPPSDFVPSAATGTLGAGGNNPITPGILALAGAGSAKAPTDAALQGLRYQALARSYGY